MKNYINKNKFLAKRHFQLLEIMVAMFILLVCIVPTLQIYTSMFKQQQGIIRENQRDHLVHLIHTKITEQLYKRQIPFEAILQEEVRPFSDPDLEKALENLSYSCSYGLTIIKPKVRQEKAQKYLCKLVIKLKDISEKSSSSISKKRVENQSPLEMNYDYYVFIQSGNQEEQLQDDDIPSSNPEEKDAETPLQTNNPAAALKTPTKPVKKTPLPKGKLE